MCVRACVRACMRGCVCVPTEEEGTSQPLYFTFQYYYCSLYCACCNRQSAALQHLVAMHVLGRKKICRLFTAASVQCLVVPCCPTVQVCRVDPVADTQWHGLRRHIDTDGIHLNDNVKPGLRTRGTYIHVGHRVV